MATKRNASNKTKTKLKRESYPYRKEYFRRNQGLFGCIWFCSQCGRPLIGKGNVVVDHIVPLNKHGINRTFNTVAICGRCNSRKSDLVDGRIVRGYIAKVVEVIVFTTQKLVILPFACMLWAGKKIFSALISTVAGWIVLIGLLAVAIWKLII